MSLSSTKPSKPLKPLRKTRMKAEWIAFKPARHDGTGSPVPLHGRPHVHGVTAGAPSIFNREGITMPLLLDNEKAKFNLMRVTKGDTSPLIVSCTMPVADKPDTACEINGEFELMPILLDAAVKLWLNSAELHALDIAIREE